MIDSVQKIKKLFSLLDQRLNEPLECYLIGGANLLAQGITTRATEDIDAVSPPYFSEHIKKHIESIALEYGLLPNWFNTMPSMEIARLWARNYDGHPDWAGLIDNLVEELKGMQKNV